MDSYEVARALSVLKANGLPINISEKLSKTLDVEFLFDGDDHLFKTALEKCQAYGEYGCGKSTLWVDKYFPSVAIKSVDTSRQWVTRVNSQIESSDEDVVVYIDVGKIGAWGRPQTFQKRHNFIQYAEALWIDEANFDVVLIDGRFRVMCFLTCLLRCGLGTQIFFDDYVDRPHYHIVEEFLKPVDYCGRQAVFVVDSTVTLDLQRIEAERDKFVYVID